MSKVNNSYNDIRKKEKLVKPFLRAIRRLLFLERKKLPVITLPDYVNATRLVV